MFQAIGAVTGLIGGLNEASANKHALEAQQRMADLQTQRQRIQQIRDARRQRAQVEQAAANSGSSDSSGAISGAQTITSQEGSNLGYINETQGLQSRITHYKQTAMNAQSLQQMGNSISSMGQDLNSPKGQQALAFFGGS